MQFYNILALPDGQSLPDARLAFRRSEDCNTESGDAASNIAGVVAPIHQF